MEICLNELLCSDEVVEELLLSLLPDKSIGFDGVSPKILRSAASSVAPFNESLQFFNYYRYASRCLETCKDCAYFQIGDKSLPSNYRPISALSTVSKV